MNSKLFVLLALIVLFYVPPAYSASEIGLYRRVAVFPIQVGVELREPAEEAWWQMREFLTEKRRFLVASKRFLTSKGVFQPRSELEPADAIILGRLLDAHIIVTSFIKGKKLYLRVYEGHAGRVVWTGEVYLQTSTPTRSQIIPSSQNLVRRFVASIPYQGFVLLDEITNRTIYDRSDRTYFMTYVGTNSGIEAGSQVQLIRMKSLSLKPILESATSEVFAEGRVVRVMHDRLEVELLRATSLEDIKENTLVRFPQEFDKIKNSLSNVGELKNLGPEYYKSGGKELSKEEKERRPLVTALSFVTNIIGMLLIAF